MSEKDGGPASAKPVAWMNPNAPEGIFARHEEGAKNFGCTVPLYAESPAQARALAIQEAAREAEKHIGYANDEWAKGANSVAYAITNGIRALSPAPSVTREWFRERVIECRALSVKTSVSAVLAALGVEVTK